MKKHVHIIGICGVTMAPLAVLYKKMGWKVTGSDRAFFPPMSTYLTQNKVDIMPGFKKKHLTQSPDFVLAMAFITEKNPEIVEAKRKKIPIKVYADVLPKLIEKKNSVIVAGDCGKTSTTALLSWMLEKAGYNPSFMIGGLPKNFDHGIRKTDSDWSVMEGDEYVASGWDNTPRFLYYSPRYLILTDVTWDHMDKFTSEKKYIDIFKKLVRNVPKDGAIIASKEGKNVKKVVWEAKAPVLFYGAKNIEKFPIPFKGEIWRKNSSAAITLARYLGMSDRVIKDALGSFMGIKRRQEIRLNKKNIVVVDDNAHTPVKVSGALQAISETFPKYEICAVYEPGNRSSFALKDKGYKDCFRKAKNIILPRVSSATVEKQNFSKRLTTKLKRHNKNCHYVANDSDVLATIERIADEARVGRKKIAFVFMSQKGFRGMLEQTISLLR